MTKRIAKKQGSSRTKKLNLKKPVHLIVLILLLLGAGLVIKNQVEVYQDKQLFKQAEAKTEEIYQQILEITGEPEKVIREKSCDRPNLKFKEGALGCYINIDSSLSVKNTDDANKILKNASGLNSNALRSGSSATINSLGFVATNTDKRQVFYQNAGNLGILSCTNSYEYSFDRVVVGVSCGGPAKVEHYPLRD